MGKAWSTLTTAPLPELRSGRAVGNTTRIVDKAIQMLFNGDTIKVEDHFKYGEDRRANERLYHLIISRLKTEYREDVLETRRISVIVDSNKLEIYLVINNQ